MTTRYEVHVLVFVAAELCIFFYSLLVLGVGLTLVVDIWRWGTLLYHSLSDSCNNTRVLSHVPQMSRCVMLACIFISGWISCTSNIVIVQRPPKTVSWYCRSGYLPGTLISIVFLAPLEVFLVSLLHFLFLPSYVHSLHCSYSALASLVCFHFSFFYYQPSAGYFWQKDLQYFCFQHIQAACKAFSLLIHTDLVSWQPDMAICNIQNRHFWLNFP